MMGDLSAAAVVQEARTCLLLVHRVLTPSELMGSPLPVRPDRSVTGDVFIDDLVILVVGSLARPPPELVQRMGRADEMYRSVGLPVKHEKSTEPALEGEAWGRLSLLG